MNEVSYEVVVRTEAPVSAVWDELCTLDRLLGHLPGISSVELGNDGTTASFSFVLSRLGRVWKQVEAQATITETAGPRSLRWTIEVPALGWQFEGTFELSPVDTDETTLVYRGAMRFSDVYTGPLHPSHAEVLEEHLNVVATRIASRAARHVRAERTLGQS